MALSPEEKARRARERMLVNARRDKPTFTKNLAKLFQKMIRAEWAALPPSVLAVVDGQLQVVSRAIGECVCVTCGKVRPWASGLGGMHTGHFLASRRNSILFEETNVAPQCSACNRYRDGEPQKFNRWMQHVRGEDAIERLERLKNTTRKFTPDELVDMRIQYAARLNAAVKRMGG